MRTAQTLILALVVLCTSCATVIAQGDCPFAVTVAPGENTNEWAYTLFNNDLTGKLRVLGLTLVWDDVESYGPAVNVVGTPLEGFWIDGTDSDSGSPASYVTWMNFDENTEPPLPGNSLSGFVIQSSQYMPVFIVSYYSTDDPTTFPDTPYCPVQQETVVPEPGSITVLLGALGCLAPLARKFRS